MAAIPIKLVSGDWLLFFKALSGLGRGLLLFRLFYEINKALAFRSIAPVRSLLNTTSIMQISGHPANKTCSLEALIFL